MLQGSCIRQDCFQRAGDFLTVETKELAFKTLEKTSNSQNILFLSIL